MASRVSVPSAAGRVHVVFTDRADGDFRVDRPGPELEARRRAIVDRPWTWLHQVHGADVVTVTEPGGGAGLDADASVTATTGCPLAVTTADCAPVVLVAERGIAVVHAGWRGLVADVIDRAAKELRAIGGDPVTSLVGPCIGPDAYEFGPSDLDHAASVFGDVVRATTADGTPALDVPRAVQAAAITAGWPPPAEAPSCTSDPRWYSHRCRGDGGRQATVAWIDPGGLSGAEAVGPR